MNITLTIYALILLAAILTLVVIFYKDKQPNRDRPPMEEGLPVVEEIADAIVKATLVIREPEEKEVPKEPVEVPGEPADELKEPVKEAAAEAEDEFPKAIECPVNNHLKLENLDAGLREELLKKISDLPQLPRAAMDLLPLLSDPKTNARDIAKVVSADPLLAGKVLRRVNSSFYALMDKIDSIQHAIMLIGFDNIRSITLRESFDTMIIPTPMGELTANKLWVHSGAVSLIARHIAQRMKNVDPELVSTVGLLHDIGLLVMMASNRDKLTQAMELSAKSTMPLCEAEEQIYGYNHQILGEMLAYKWNLSDELARSIGNHHSPYVDNEPHPVAGAVWFAHTAATQFGYTYRHVSFPEEESEKLASALGVQWPVIKYTTRRLLSELQKVATLWEASEVETSESKIRNKVVTPY